MTSSRKKTSRGSTAILLPFYLYKSHQRNNVASSSLLYAFCLQEYVLIMNFDEYYLALAQF